MGDIIIKIGIFVIAFMLGLTVSSAVGFFGEKPWSPVTTPGDTVSLDIPLGEAGGTEILKVPSSLFPMKSYNPIGPPFSDDYQSLPGGIKYDLEGFHYIPAENEYLSSATTIEQLIGGGPYQAVSINGQPVTYNADGSLYVPVSPSYQVANPSYQVANPSYAAVPGSGTSISGSGTSISGGSTSISGSSSSSASGSSGISVSR
jgi:hypothetical protein